MNNLIKIWSSKDLFPNSSTQMNGLGKLDNGKFVVIVEATSKQIGMPNGYDEIYLVNSDSHWEQAFERINSGLAPSWELNAVKEKNIPANNDGREFCYVCCHKTKTIQGFQSVYQICVNEFCRMNGK